MRALTLTLVLGLGLVTGAGASAPDHQRVDRSIFRAGQHVNFYRRTGAFACTTAFVVRRHGRLFGLTSGHCSNRPGDTAVRVRGLDAPPRQALGAVAWDGLRHHGPDALAFGLEGVAAVQEVERGNRPPWTVTGWRRTADQRAGLRVCFAGRTSGVDRCGRITHPRFRRGVHRLVCTSLRLRDGDSGGPVYTRPAGGAVEALGIVTGSRVPFLPFSRGEGCYTPIGTILARFGATLPAA